MNRDIFDPSWEDTVIVLVDEQLLARAQRRLRGCEECDPEDAQFRFDRLLDLITGNDPLITDYILAAPASCPRCKRPITEKTGVSWDFDNDGDRDPTPEPTILASA